MSPRPASCVLLAERHSGLTEGIRGLLSTVFDIVIMVSDKVSLLEGAKRLRPTLVVMDLSLASENTVGLLRQLHRDCPDLKAILLSVHDEASVAFSVLDAGAVGCVLKRGVATDLLPAVEAVLAGGTYVSSGFGPPAATK